MASQIPTFSSKMVTRTPEMGIVQQTGLRAYADANKQWARTYDALAEWGNKKLDQYMETHQKNSGIEAAMQAGFDPNQLDNPITAADRIYRESAINTYMMRLQTDLEDNISRMSLSNQYNPTRFQAQASEYLKTTATNLPIDMQPSVARYGEAMAVRAYTQIAKETQVKVMAEAKEATKMRMTRLRSRYILSNDQSERDTIMAEAAATIDNDPNYLTPGLKLEAIQNFARGTEVNSTLSRVMRGELAPTRALQQLEANGIAVEMQEFNQLFSAAGVRMSYNGQARAEQTRLRGEQVKELQSQMFFDLQDMKDKNASFDQLQSAIEGSVNELVFSGVPVDDASKFGKTLTSAVNAVPKTDAFVKNSIDYAIAAGDAQVPAMINAGVAARTIAPADAIALKTSWEQASSTPMNSIAGKQLKTHMEAYVPIIDPAVVQGELNAQQKNKLQEQNVRNTQLRQEMTQQFIDRVNNGESAVDVRKAIVAAYADQVKKSVDYHLSAMYGSSGAKVARWVKDGVTIQVPSSQANPRKKEQQEIYEFDKIDESNWRDVYTAMKRSQQVSEKRGIASQYDEEMLRALHEMFSKAGGSQ